jgi:hypothetical protein
MQMRSPRFVHFNLSGRLTSLLYKCYSRLQITKERHGNCGPPEIRGVRSSIANSGGWSAAARKSKETWQ